MNKGIFKYRGNIKPVEYSGMEKYIDAIDKSHWTVHEFNFDSDVAQFKVSLTDEERSVIKKTMLAISHIENKVKSFWGEIGNRLPKPEISNVGYKFSGNEVTHQIAYSELLSLLGLEHEFENLDEVCEISGRTDYLQKYLEGVKSKSNKEFTKSLILFTLLIENASLFSQFFIIANFYKHKNLLMNISKVIQATGREEVIHGNFGARLINIIREENPEWFDDDMEDKVRRNVLKAYEAEVGIIDWIFSEGDLDFVKKSTVKSYLKSRFNNSLNQIGYENEFVENPDHAEKYEFFENLMETTTDFDFFAARSSDYNKGKKYTIDEIF